MSVSVAIYVATSVIVAAVRWGHKCEPFARHEEYYYPSWRTTVACFLTNLLLVPVIVLPHDWDAQLQLRMMLIISSPFLSASMMFSYFGKLLKVKWWRLPISALALLYFPMTGVAAMWTIMPGDQLVGHYTKAFFATTGGIALLFFACYFMALRMLAKAMKKTAEESYSNPEDFPREYAQTVFWIPVAHVAISWITTYVGSQIVMGIGLLLLAALAVVFLIGVLPPHRSLDINQLEEKKEMEEMLSPKRKEYLLKQIRHKVEDEQAYLDSHLSLASLAQKCGVNRTYVSVVLNESMGGFFSYVNHCRLAHAAKLKVDNPEMPVGKVIAASGFGSRQTYYNIRKQLEEQS